METNILPGTVEMLILEVLARAPSYGYEIVRTVVERSEGAFELKEGSLYPALHRLEREKLLGSYWTETEQGRRRKYYRLLAAGRRALKARRREWKAFVRGVQGVLGEKREVV